ncbi:hypothetical protein D3C75_1165750 [compost metagenome]
MPEIVFLNRTVAVPVSVIVLLVMACGLWIGVDSSVHVRIFCAAVIFCCVAISPVGFAYFPRLIACPISRTKCLIDSSV